MPRLWDELERAVAVFGHGLEALFSEPKNSNIDLIPNLACNGSGQQKWSKGDLLFR